MKYVLALVLLLVAFGALNLRSFGRWNKRRISDNTDWSFFLESYSYDQFTFRHDHKLLTGPCLFENQDEPTISCDMLKNHVGDQLVGEMKPGAIALDSMVNAYIRIDEAHQVR
jgi:hypothetical protein